MGACLLLRGRHLFIKVETKVEEGVEYFQTQATIILSRRISI